MSKKRDPDREPNAQDIDLRPEIAQPPDHLELMQAGDPLAMGYQAAVNRLPWTQWPDAPSESWLTGWEYGRLWVARQESI